VSTQILITATHRGPSRRIVVEPLKVSPRKSKSPKQAERAKSPEPADRANTPKAAPKAASGETKQRP
jgi:hypothetical protein